MSSLSRAELQKMFNEYDLNNDGKISESEMVSVLKSYSNLSSEMTRAIFYETDTDKDGFINFEVELSEFCQSEKRRELKATFEELDVDNDGEINEEELRLFLGDVSTPEEVHRLFLVADENGDGKICLEEFLTQMLSTE